MIQTLLLGIVLMMSPPTKYQYITVTFQVPVGTNPQDVVKVVDSNPYAGVYVIDAQELPGIPKRAKRPIYLMKIPTEEKQP